MMKKWMWIALAMVLVWGSTSVAGDFKKVEITHDTCNVSEYKLLTDFSNYRSLGIYFKLTTADALRSDSAHLWLRTGKDQFHMRRIAELSRALADTTTRYKFFFEDSAAYSFSEFVDIELMFGDASTAIGTALVESLATEGDSVLYEWSSTNASHESVIDEYRSAPTYTNYIFLGDTTDTDGIPSTLDSMDIINVANHTATELVDSVVVSWTQSAIKKVGCEDSIGLIIIGIALGDTVARDTTGMTQTRKSPSYLVTADTVCKTASFTTCPSTNLAWTPSELDSINIIFQNGGIKGGVQVRVYSVDVRWYAPRRHSLSPATKYDLNLIFKE